MEDTLRFHTDAWDLSVDLKAGRAAIVVIDARCRDAYIALHIPAAVSFLHREMNSETTARLDRGKVYVVYCDGIGCNASTKGAYKLARLGFRTKELLEGLDWRRAMVIRSPLPMSRAACSQPPNSRRQTMSQLEDGERQFTVSPDGYSLDNFYMARPGANEVHLDLFGDYKSNVALYPAFQEYFRAHKPRFLAAWGRNDPFFLPAGAEAFRRDIPSAVVRFFETGHFALETRAAEIAEAIRDFLAC